MAGTERRRSAEAERLADAHETGAPWRKWGPYLSERQWGTVREDYSEGGDAWNGAGLGASHQTGWTGIVATMMQLFATTSAAQVLEQGKMVVAQDRRRATGGPH